MSSLKHRVADGFASLAGRQAVLALILPLAGICLARLLPPRDFGTLGTLAFLCQALSLFAALGLGEALTRRAASSQEEGATAFLQLAAAALFATALILSGPFLGRALDLSTAELGMLPAVAGALLLSTIRVTWQARLERALYFRALARLDWAAQLIPQGLALIMAWKGFGLASLVAAMLAREAIMTAGIGWMSRRTLPKLHLSGHPALLREGAPFLGSAVLAMANSAAIAIYLRRQLGGDRIGYVFWAAGLGLKPQQLIDLAGRVLYPAYALLKDQPEALGQAVERATRLTACGVLAAAALLAALSEPLIRMVYTAKWLPAREALAAYALALGPILLYLVAARALLALGESRCVLRINVANTAAFWATLVSCKGPFPLLSAPMALTLSNGAAFLLAARALSRRAPVRWGAALRAPISAAVAAGTAAFGISRVLPGWSALLAGAAGGGGVLLAILSFSAEKPLQEIWGLLRRRGESPG